MGQKFSKAAKQQSFGNDARFSDKTHLLPSRKNESRSLFKKCFKNPLFSLVPFEIWMMIANEAGPKSISRLSQTCWGFKELVESVAVNNLNLAKRFRSEGQIPLALKYLQMCADNGSTTAMFYLGHACHDGGWGLKKNKRESAEWFKKAAERGNASSMAFYAFCLKWGSGGVVDAELCFFWGQRALSTKSPFAVGMCYFLGLGVPEDRKKALDMFEVEAKAGDEYCQTWLGYCFEQGYGTERNYEKAFFWFRKPAEQGSAACQFQLGIFYRDGKGCKKDEQMARIWFQKSANQNYIDAINCLSITGANNKRENYNF